MKSKFNAQRHFCMEIKIFFQRFAAYLTLGLRMRAGGHENIGQHAAAVVLFFSIVENMSSKTALASIRDYGSDLDEEFSGTIEETAGLPTSSCNSSGNETDLPGTWNLTKRKKAQIRTMQKRIKTHRLVEADCACALDCSKKISRYRRNQLNSFYWKSSLEAIVHLETFQSTFCKSSSM